MDKILVKIKKLLPRKLFKALQPVYHFLMSWIASVVYRWPSDNLIVIGVTGTTGKTTITYLVAKMFANSGYKVGYTSTAMFGDGNKEWLNDKKMTMMGRFFTQGILRKMIKNGCQYAIIETTSEGIRQYRHRFINYDILVFPGLYPEHIESHGSFLNYKKTKGELFAHLKRCKTKYADDNRAVHTGLSNIRKLDLKRVKKTIIANLDDDNAEYFLDFWAEEKYGYAKKQETRNKKQDLFSNIKIIEYSDIVASEKGTSFQVGDNKIALQLLGEFNATNAMAAYCVGEAQEIAREKIKLGLESVSGIPGRLEKIDEGQKFVVIVDYAFEPKAVEKLYETVKFIPHNKIIHVLGSAGGGRDVARRPILGKVAGANADYVIVTNEDPYDDDPQIIIDQVEVGAEHAGKKKNENLFNILDRREAIKKALSLAETGDIVLITGKGSEQAICVANGEKIPWDDRRVVREQLTINN
ncbi:MAG: UDP-N-acetylmuramyl-tripeptide synthetase [Patescibacteria group bacterium]|nr:UDP-N-acetylmuramyl-tripeptide synthetase [Patescibacteria group bacterium]MDD4610807.1 UDP-N-acetylmuramyl-tripeptide synthetase [Patescibacteria group bacterium]